jgi:hypothetical protein
VLLAGLRRFAVLVLVMAVLAVGGGLVGALLFHAGAQRAISVACYGFGGFLLLSGFFHGVRPPLRVDDEQGVPSMFGVLLTRGKLRHASLDERQDSIASSALFVVLGIVLIVIGALLDPRHGVL